jgi:hypothetical protein
VTRKWSLQPISTLTKFKKSGAIPPLPIRLYGIVCQRLQTAVAEADGYTDFQYHSFFIIIPVYLHSVQVHSVNWLREVDECLGEGRWLALFYN